jgi:hypothetical protein
MFPSMAVMVPRTLPGVCANAAALTMASAPKTAARRNELIGSFSSEVVGRIRNPLPRSTRQIALYSSAMDADSGA